jgi:polysaccharide biosynthesis/export protein
MRWFLIVLVSLVALGCGRQRELSQDFEMLLPVPGALPPEAPPPPRRACRYVIQPGDRLEIGVWGEDDMTKRLSVDQDGRISYFRITDVKAAGKTTRALEQELPKHLKKWFGSRPVFSVTLIRPAGKFISITGVVASPGWYSLGKEVRLLTLLANAQRGWSWSSSHHRHSDAKPDWSQAFVLRGDKFLDVDFEKLLDAKGSTPREKILNNPLLQPGDRVYVPGLVSPGNRVYVVGVPRRPRLIRYSKEITFLEAMLRAEDIPCSVWERKIFIIRGKMKHPTIIPVNVRLVRTGRIADILLKPGDVIFVPKTRIEKTGEVICRLDAIYGQVAQAETMYRKTPAFDR